MPSGSPRFCCWSSRVKWNSRPSWGWRRRLRVTIPVPAAFFTVHLSLHACGVVCVYVCLSTRKGRIFLTQWTSVHVCTRLSCAFFPVKASGSSLLAARVRLPVSLIRRFMPTALLLSRHDFGICNTFTLLHLNHSPTLPPFTFFLLSFDDKLFGTACFWPTISFASQESKTERREKANTDTIRQEEKEEREGEKRGFDTVLRD